MCGEKVPILRADHTDTPISYFLQGPAWHLEITPLQVENL